MSDAATVAEALQSHYAASGLPRDGGRSAEQWTLELGPLRVRLNNFAWRRRALQDHDVHHLLTGYARTPAGELEIAAWEFAAGRFPNLFSTLFCLPLVSIGALVIPRRSFAAFARGRRSRTLYGTPMSAELLALPLREVRRRLVADTQQPITLRDLIDYLGLASLSLALLAAPISALAILFLTRG